MAPHNPQIDGVFAEFIDDIDLRPDCTSPTTGTDGDPMVGVGFWVNAMTVRDSRDVPDPRPTLREVHVPVLVLRAECDYLAWGVTREYRDILPDAVLLPIDDAGHSIARDRPGLYLAILEQFLRDGSLAREPHTSDQAPW